MDCARVAREELLASYLLGRLSDEDRDAVEEHYFECARCFDDLQTIQAARHELLHTPDELDNMPVARSFMSWSRAAGLAAGVVLAVGVMLWMRAPSSSPAREVTGSPSPSTARPTEGPQSRPPQPSPAAAPSLEQLARIEPPVYEPRTLRGPSDEAMQRFERGMDRYRKADYAGAARDLRGAADLDPDAAHIGFFLGISYLMSGQDQAAIERLRATIALGDSPYREDARFYLAKTFLRRADLKAAETQLREVVKLRGSRRIEAQSMLTEIERLTQR